MKLTRGQWTLTAAVAVLILVATMVWFAGCGRETHTEAIDQVAVSTDGKTLTVEFTTSELTVHDARVQARETEADVRLEVTVTQSKACYRAVRAVGVRNKATVTLQRPLGERRILDADGKELPRSD